MINKNYRHSESGIQVSDSDVKKLSRMFEDFKIQSDKSIGTGLVTKINNSEVWVDVKLKSEGVLSLEEFNLKGFGQMPMVGDTIEVWIQSTDISFSKKTKGNDQSNISFARAAQIRSWHALEQKYRESDRKKKTVDGIILSKVPGGYVVSILPYAARGFLPLSQADPQISKSDEALQRYKNEIHQYVIIRMERNLNIILSRREAMYIQNSEESESEPESEKQVNKHSNRESANAEESEPETKKRSK